jgi:Mrp family chromosome partitioning ATPase
LDQILESAPRSSPPDRTVAEPAAEPVDAWGLPGDGQTATDGDGLDLFPEGSPLAEIFGSDANSADPEPWHDGAEEEDQVVAPADDLAALLGGSSDEPDLGGIDAVLAAAPEGGWQLPRQRGDVTQAVPVVRAGARRRDLGEPVRVPAKARKLGLEPGPHLLHGSGRPCVIPYTTPKGGTGKTSSTLNGGLFLGRALEPYGRRVVVVDGNYRQANIASYIGDTKMERTISDLRGLPMDADGVASVLTRPGHIQTPVTFLYGPRPLDESQSLSADEAVNLYGGAVRVLAEEYDYVLIDMAPASLSGDPDPMFDQFMWDLADFTVIVLPTSVKIVADTARWLPLEKELRDIRGQSFDMTRVGAFLNGETPEINCDADMVRGIMASSGVQWLTSVPRLDEMTNALNANQILDSDQLFFNYAELFYRITGEEMLLDEYERLQEVIDGGREDDAVPEPRRGRLLRR